MAKAREAWLLTENKSKEAKAYISAVQSYEQVLSATEEREQEREVELVELSETVSGLSEALMRKDEDNARWREKCQTLEQELARARKSLALVAARTSEREALSSRPASAATPALGRTNQKSRPLSASSLLDVARELKDGGRSQSAFSRPEVTTLQRPQTALLYGRKAPLTETGQRPRPFSSAGVRRARPLSSLGSGPTFGHQGRRERSTTEKEKKKKKNTKEERKASQTRLRPLSGTSESARAVRHSHVGMLLKLAGRSRPRSGAQA